MSAKELAAAHQADRELGVDGTLGNPEPRGDGPMAEALNPAQREYLPAAGWKGAHGGSEKFEFLFTAQRFGRIGPLFYNGQLPQIT